ncbi:hypothetical protein HG536_0C02630 [Torulaspora globosa]|uniref:Uncharacterized protein n=1 Tax=Torulaspora globosa TaxID=48254 RepID=A0A7G3ZF08_9SACH|nr:uncharacterized protein HG536_0C02630 [Torulaspora globosa]QLL32094.1 hypothetical protein HG536_0C02630 [Torulaspora globosa]
MLKFARPQITRNLACLRSSFTTTSRLGTYKEWKQLSDDDKRNFIHSYVSFYKEKHPCSKSNVMYRSLAEGMDEHGDIPYVFGILYNEIRSVTLGESTENKRGQGILGDPGLQSLLK